tara:strand:+ start:1791 stop:2531 length:741 start_codon:yes stop_codon:yes gene_type:complete
MYCQYLRHIDLQSIYESLTDPDNQYLGKPLPGIPHSVSNTLTMLLEDHADMVIQSMYDEDANWQLFHPADLAAEVGDSIEQDIEQLGLWCSEESGMEASLPAVLNNDSAAEWILPLQTISIYASFSEHHWQQQRSLLICQYDFLCWLHSTGDFDSAMEVFDLIVQTLDSTSFQEMKGRRSEQSRDAAAVTHKKNREQKAAALNEWDKHGAKVSSMAAFARARHKDFGVTERTLYTWVREHRRTTVP